MFAPRPGLSVSHGRILCSIKVYRSECIVMEQGQAEQIFGNSPPARSLCALSMPSRDGGTRPSLPGHHRRDIRSNLERDEVRIRKTWIGTPTEPGGRCKASLLV